MILIFIKNGNKSQSIKTIDKPHNCGAYLCSENNKPKTHHKKSNSTYIKPLFS